ncbi:MAG: hypothetical protein JSS24_10000, partial [Proteobacteria bacterium]|nr:hypothetical protein [Pseudomonadota bacterium]
MTRGSSGRFRPPAIAAHEVVRPRLLMRISPIEDLGEAFCTLVLGPAGFGKTTLLAHAYRELQSQRRPTLWLECSALDTDPVHLFDSLYAAGSTIGMPAGEFEFTTNDFARRMAALGGPLTLFLDGFERLIGSDGELLIDRLLAVLPGSARLVAASRHAPGTWFLQRELRGLASTIDARDLRLTYEELVALLPSRFTEADIERVACLTEGWPVAVQMTRLRAGDTASISEMLDRLPHDGLGLFDFLASRVTETLSPLQRSLLRDTSILPVITPSVANAVMERDDGYTLLSGVLRLQPIVTITGDREFTVRLHPLFGQYLRLELAREGQEYEARLHRRAAMALAASGAIHDAVQHALAAGDVALAVDLFERAGAESLAFLIGPPQLHSLIAILPPAARQRSVRLRFTDIVLASLDGRARTVAALREELHRILADKPCQTEPWRMLAMGFSDMLLAMLYDPYENTSSTILERSAEVERIARQHFATDETYLGLVLAIKFFLLARYGSVADARRTLAEYVALCERNHFAPRLPSVSPQRGLLAFLSGDYDAACALLTHKPGQRVDRFSEPEPLLVQLSTAILATIHYERNEPEAAWHLTNQLLIDADRTFPETWALGVRARVLSLEALGRREETDRTLLQEMHIARTRDASRLMLFLQAIDSELRLRRAESYEDAAPLQAALEDELARDTASWILIEQLARAVVPSLLLAGQTERARRIAARLTARAAACGHETREALGHLLSARIDDVAGNEAEVSQHLAAALSRTARTRTIRLYLDLWGKETSLVRMLSDLRIAPFSDHLRAILRALQVLRPEGGSGWTSLSERERDVLSALSAHATTKAIAKHLALSPETVKHHLKRIFAKLGVHSREQALKRIA